MNIGVVSHGRTKSMIVNVYENNSYFHAIDDASLRRLSKENLKKCIEIYPPFTDLSVGLTTRETSEVMECAKNLYENHQYEIALKALDKLAYPSSMLFRSGLLKEETEKSIKMLSDKFTLEKISRTKTRKVASYYQLKFDYIYSDITFNNVIYKLQATVLVKKSPFDFKVINENFDVVKKEGVK